MKVIAIDLKSLVQTLCVAVGITLDCKLIFR